MRPSPSWRSARPSPRSIDWVCVRSTSPPTIILLTAVHFHFAGFVLPLAGALAYGRRPGRWLEIALGAVVVGIPITALGFLGIPYANWIGAMLTAVGGFGIGVATDPRRSTPGPAAREGPCPVVAGASLLVSMPMAAIYATGTLVGTTGSICRRWRGSTAASTRSASPFPVIVAWTLDRRSREMPTDRADLPADPRRLGLGAAGDHRRLRGRRRP